MSLSGVGRDDEDLGVAADDGKAGGAVVLRQRIAFDVHLHVVAVEAGLGQGLGKGEEVLAGGEFDLFFAEKLFVAKEPDGGRGGLVGLDEDFDLEGLALLELGRHLEFLHRDIVGDGHAHGHARPRSRPSCWLAASTALMASPTFSLPSVSRTRRFWPVSGKAAVPSRIAAARSVRSVPTTAWIFCKSRAELGEDSMLASLPKTITPALSVLFFCLAILLT